MQFTRLLGCDFSSSPNRRKPIVVARGRLCIDEQFIQLQQLMAFDSLDAWQQWLASAEHGPWVGGFDLPFGLPRSCCKIGLAHGMGGLHGLLRRPEPCADTRAVQVFL